MSARFDLAQFKKISSLLQGFLAASDEVGRGCLAGPVVVGTVYLQFSGQEAATHIKKFLGRLSKLGVTDSKRLNSKQRQGILAELGVDYEKLPTGQKLQLLNTEFLSLCFAVVEVEPLIVDQLNILHASLWGMKRSFEICYEQVPKARQKNASDSGLWLVDGHLAPPYQHELVSILPVVKGDQRSLLIGLASLIAKEHRDLLMHRMDELYPGYGFGTHVGYPTAAHKQGLKQLGISPIHRKTFKGVRELLS